MRKANHEKILSQARKFFRQTIAINHIKSCQRAAKLSGYNVNPFIVKYLANFLRGNGNPRSIAEALIYPRVLGTSITTSFGTSLQRFISMVLQGFGSATSGIDIEFIDQLDGHKKYCQLKLGPNCINKDGVTTIVNHFKQVRNRARTNRLRVGTEDLIVGVLYGMPDQLNANYKKLSEDHGIPVYVGQEFWQRLTGRRKFYFDLIEAFGEVALETDGTKTLKNTIATLAKDIKNNFKL